MQYETFLKTLVAAYYLFSSLMIHATLNIHSNTFNFIPIQKKKKLTTLGVITEEDIPKTSIKYPRKSLGKTSLSSQVLTLLKKPTTQHQNTQSSEKPKKRKVTLSKRELINIIAEYKKTTRLECGSMPIKKKNTE